MVAELRAWSRGMAATPRFDFVLVAVVIVLAESEIWLPTGNCVGRPFPFGLCNFGESLGPRSVEIVYTTLAALALLARRHRPVQVLLVVSALSVLKSLVWVASPGLGYFLPVLVASYSVGRYHRGGHSWLVLIAAGLVVAITSVVHDLRVPGQIPSGQLATFYALLLGVLPIGRSLQVKDLRIELSEATAREATLARDEAARRAVAEERGRIARELHDVAAHGVSLIVVQAVAAQGVLDRAPGRARASLEAIETEARQALDEMRRLLAVLQPEAEANGLEPAPGLDALGPLVSRVVAAGQPVEMDIEDGSSGLSPGLQLTLYRCVQEALTNVVKHAHGAATKVSLRLSDDQVELEVANGPGHARSQSTGGGRGLVGMRERVVLYGGVLEAGPSQNGGFRVHASIPVGTAS